MICDRFEEAWRQKKKPRIEEFLQEVRGEEQGALLHELLATELEYRRKHRERVVVDPYLERFPRFASVVRGVFSSPDPSTTPDDALESTREFLAGADLQPNNPASHLLSALPAEVLKDHLTEQEFASGQCLMRQGEIGTSLMIICDGLVDVSTMDASGTTHVIGHAGRGETLGEMSLLTAQPRTANVVAADHVRALVMPVDTFHELARQYPELSVIITNLVADRLGKPGRDALADKRMDRYRIKQRLGRGGMGIVYEAEDIKSNERVALKMLSHRLVYSAEALRRFRQEADIIAAFEHQNIVRLLHRFAAFHTYFIAMEYCQGQTLQELLASEGPLSEPMLRGILGQLASALDYAHQANIVHRDIKPANIMLDPKGTVKLMDFGLAEPVSSRQQAGQVYGTPRFMAPEQRIGRGAGKEVDYFALGCVAYEMLTCEPLFGAGDLDELTRDFANWQPPDFKTIRPALSQETCRLLQPALNKDHRLRQLDLQRISTWASCPARTRPMD